VDTRTKIQSLEDAAASAAAARSRGEKIRLVAGTFDVLLTAHARDLQAQPQTAVFAGVRNGSRSVLPLAARLELVAAFRDVRAVVALEGNLDAVIVALRPDEVVDRTAVHELQLRQFIQHVHQRHAG
jgi:hypothetical protein